jgi:hypothetical protein
MCHEAWIFLTPLFLHEVQNVASKTYRGLIRIIEMGAKRPVSITTSIIVPLMSLPYGTYRLWQPLKTNMLYVISSDLYGKLYYKLFLPESVHFRSRAFQLWGPVRFWVRYGTYPKGVRELWLLH